MLQLPAHSAPGTRSGTSQDAGISQDTGNSHDTGRPDIASERGVALILTVFILALATVLVFDLAQSTVLDQRANRVFVEGVQQDYILKSALNLSTKVFELPPKIPNTHSLLDPWANVASLSALPIESLNSEVQLAIVDESSKLNVNRIGASGGQSPPPGGGSQSQANPNQGTVFWLEAAKQLFQAAGIQREVGERGSARVTYSAEDQVAVIHDWIDADNSSFTVQGFTGQGSERQLGKVFFANRPLVDLSELLLVPGFSSERAQRIAPFVTTAQTFQVNVNTAPPEVLTALAVAAQVPATLVNSLIMARLDQPFTSQSLSQLLQQGGNQPLLAYLTTRSSGFTAYARVTSANRTRWASAAIKAGSGAGQKATLERRALY